MQYKATGAGSYYAPLIPGEWPTAKAAIQAAVASTDPQSIATNKELIGNIYKMQNGKYSWTLPFVGSANESSISTSDIPPDTMYAGNYHITVLLMFNDVVFGLGTPAGRIEIFDPSQFRSFPFGCVLVGPAVTAAPNSGTSSVAVPTCR